MRRSPRIVQRGTPEWLGHLVETGAWWQPPYWREHAYQETSPWTAKELDDAFAAAAQIFDAKTTKRLARERAELVGNLLCDFGTAPFSGLLHLGLDASVATIQDYPDLTKRLRHDREHAGAAFELDVIAALCRAGLDFDYAPFRGRAKHPNPDFRLRVGGEVLILDAKAAQTAALVRENQEWMDTLMSHLQQVHTPPYEIEYLPDFVTLHRSEDGRSWVRSKIREIGRAMAVRLRQLSLGQHFPAEDQLVVDGKRVLRIAARGPLAKTSSGSLFGAAFDVETEAKRITRGLLQDGASQIPLGMKGLVLVRAGVATTTSALVEETEAWLSGDGRAYPDLAGALLVSGEVVDEWYWQRVTPVWRAGQRPLAPSVWPALERGLNHVALRVVPWMQARARSLAKTR